MIPALDARPQFGRMATMNTWLKVWTVVTTALFFFYLTDDVREPWLRVIFSGVAAVAFYGFGVGIAGCAGFVWDKLTR
jgi:hypothetical protein